MHREVIPITQQSPETTIRKAVKQRYAKLASENECCGNDCCNDSTSRDTQQGSIPKEAAQIAAGCGTPLAHAEILQGQILVDLGSGGGIDVFRASSLVGPHGRAIGIDATPEMIWRARETAKKNGYTNVEFRLGEIENIPVETESADWVVSNCVINLAPDKVAVFKEAFRILREGGGLVVSDIVAEEPVPLEAQNLMTGWAACITGAILEEEYLDDLSRAGFSNVQVIERRLMHPQSLEPPIQQELKLASLTITAVKPTGDRN
jgi:arsenite methyltransferase